MARGFEVAVGADGRAFNQAIRSDVIKPVEEAARSLDELADAGEDAGRDGSRGLQRLEDALKDAQRQSEKTERSLDDIGDGGKSSFGKVQEGAQELSQEVGSNLGEAVSSFRGDLGDLAQVGQDTFGGLAATLASAGPWGLVGAAALAAAAIGAGGIAASIEDADARAQELRDRANEVASAWIDAGKQMLDADTLNAAISGVIGDEEKMKRADELVQKLGVDLPTAIRILAGDQNALAASEEKYQAQLRLRNDLVEKGTFLTGAAKDANREQIGVLNEWISTYEDQAGVFSSASDKFTAGTQAQNDALLDLIESSKDATVQIDRFGNKLVTLPDGQEIVIDVDTGRATHDVNEFKGDVNSIPKQKATRVNLIAPSGAEVARMMADVQRKVSGTTVRIKGAIVAPDGRRLLQ